MRSKQFGSKFRDRRRLKIKPEKLLNLFYFCLMVVGFYFIVFNVTPYFKMVVYLNKLILNAEFTNLWEQIIIAGVAIAFWAVIQLIELAPLLMMRNSKFLKKIIDKAEQFTKYKINLSDNPTINSMKNAYNNLPISFVRDLRLLSVIIYFVDLLINLFINPPIKGGANQVWRIAYGRTDLINWSNIFISVQTVTIVEIVVIGLLWTWALIQIFSNEQI